MGQNGSLDAGAIQDGSADLDVVAIGNHQDVLDFDLAAYFSGQAFNLEFSAGSYLVLLASGSNDRVHASLQNWPMQKNSELYMPIVRFAIGKLILLVCRGACPMPNTE